MNAPRPTVNNTHFDGRLGAHVVPGGVQFAVHAAPAGVAQLLLFACEASQEPSRIIDLDPTCHRSGSYWHIFVPGIGHGQIYNWCLTTAKDTTNETPPQRRALIDPYGVAIAGWENYDRKQTVTGDDNTHCALRSVVLDLEQYDWRDDAPPPAPVGREFIYETHVAAFTAHPNSGLNETLRGTYAGLARKAEHLVQLGITTVELMPVYAFDPQDAPADRANYWGYSPVSFFAPHPDYAMASEPAEVLDEFRDMIRTLHRAGLRVILDVVYNHTAEAGPDGPTISWRGFDDAAYYIQGTDPQQYLDFTGCGNTFNGNHPVGSRMITDSLRHWTSQLHIDGFRFDLAATMIRDVDGAPLQRPPVIWAIDTDPALAATQLIAEAWDAGGLHRVGNFPGTRFACWNGPYRDTVRQFFKGDKGMIEDLMARIVGSPDLFKRPDDRPAQSINFVTCHDGFTLRDLVTYEQKYNAENGEHNRDGSDDNRSWHSGVEGVSQDPEVMALRERRIRNFITLLCFSHGTPMLLAGDEWGQSRQGNNNPWCLDNERNWLDWDLARDNADLLRFVTECARLANSFPLLTKNQFWRATCPDQEGDITWHGCKPHTPDWTPSSRHLAYELIPEAGNGRILVLLNAEPKACVFELAAPPEETQWHCVIDTGAVSPADISPGAIVNNPVGAKISVPTHTSMVFLARP